MHFDNFNLHCTISIHALLAESDGTVLEVGFIYYISIHALLAESDSPPSITPTASRNFYPRSPCGERPVPTRALRVTSNFYPRSPCGERLVHALKLANAMLFLSTLSLRRATFKNHIFFRHHSLFLSTLSLRRATIVSSAGTMGKSFLSTLSLRRATIMLTGILAHHAHFYPRSPCGERQSTSL